MVAAAPPIGRPQLTNIISYVIDPALVEERGVALRNSCGLVTRKSLFVLHDSTQLRASVVRVENAFLELSKQCYTNADAMVQERASSLDSHNEQIRQARYLFKSSFYAELKQDPKGALRQYRASYDIVKQLQHVRVHETKTVAGLLALKICQLLFAQSQPVDALRSFREHISLLRGKVGRKELTFQHKEWLAHQ